MSNLRPTVITGSIIDLPINPHIALKWVTRIPHGPPIKPRPKARPVEETPKDLGEERHLQMLSAIKGLKVNQNVSQNVEDALVQNRDWRH